MNNMWVEIKNINKSFGDKIIFWDFNLEIESGSIVIISGESGRGKTTLLNIIGTIEDYEGTILYDGKRLKNKKEILRIFKYERRLYNKLFTKTKKGRNKVSKSYLKIVHINIFFDIIT